MNLPLFHRRPDCMACEICTEASTVCVPTVWLSSSLPPSPFVPAVIMIGQNPGFEEDLQGVPFVPRTYEYMGEMRQSSGELLRNTYIDGIDLCSRASIYLTNAARCGPRSDIPKGSYSTCFPLYTAPDIASILEFHSCPPSSLPSSSLPSPSLQPAASPSPPPLLSTSESTSGMKTDTTKATPTAKAKTLNPLESPSTPPKLAVVLLGGAACFSFHHHYTRKGISLDDAFLRNGEALQINHHRVNVFATYHPAFVLRDGNNIHAVNGHMGLVSYFLAGVMAEPSNPRIIPLRNPPP